jgi:translation elongation factor EF-Tu-like GTPase
MAEYADIHVRVRLTADGGRTDPLAACGGVYRPHLRVGELGEYLGVAFVSGPSWVAPGDEADVTVRFLYDVDYSPLQPGTKFEVVEGARVVADGIVLRRWESDRDSRS